MSAPAEIVVTRAAEARSYEARVDGQLAVRGQYLAVLAVCPSVSGWLARHPEYQDLLYRSRTTTLAD